MLMLLFRVQVWGLMLLPVLRFKWNTIANLLSLLSAIQDFIFFIASVMIGHEHFQLFIYLSPWLKCKVYILSRDLLFFTILFPVPRTVCSAWLVLNRYLPSECMHVSGNLWGNSCCLGLLKFQVQLQSILWSFSDAFMCIRKGECVKCVTWVHS